MKDKYSNIRPYISSDKPSICEIYAKSKLDEVKFEDAQFELLPLEEDDKRHAELFESDIYVYETDNVIAYGAVYQNEIRALFVSPEHRGLGVGRELLEFLLSEITGVASLFLAKSNMLAKQLYESMGFAVVDEFETTYNGVAVIANKMTKSNK